ncbi:hypothetical protein AVEN_199808-1 [Araneus ventricosus]|uniref:Uncharacterized protein n=1 Tax=Araneus ventricosus TaxID=182803 RepID=A0A4Y2U0F4_ARAVE|nr:hypothetical protein AVEN_199808-1 [Araneus ventricosus]
MPVCVWGQYASTLSPRPARLSAALLTCRLIKQLCSAGLSNRQIRQLRQLPRSNTGGSETLKLVCGVSKVCFHLLLKGHGPFPSYLYRFRLHHSDICICGEKGDPLHYATSCHMTLSYQFTKPSAENTQLWWKSLLSNKLSRIKISKLISFLTENENLIKQPPDATSSSDSDPDFSHSSRPQTYGLRPSRGSILRTLVSPPASI